ncbi:hypothetical protein AVDCRST_MAG84-5467 [uncultured Microcoleus sp.]|uniref:Uncharacterized protein n=1 Tax=uncultured Microcoleus sp. TaxID=259945 RepID=A0A6J4NHG0_9CYAN|nr:hypothetical protein AVDCRST_MAG84-5467 [uncultured Microcoleus sp.]
MPRKRKLLYYFLFMPAVLVLVTIKIAIDRTLAIKLNRRM